MKKRTALIILFSVLILMVGALIAQIVIEKSFTSEIAVRTLIPMGLCVSAIARVMTGDVRKIKNTKLYETEYAKEIGNAFFANEGAKKQLINAIHLFNEKKYNDTEKKLSALLEVCENDFDYRAVYFFLAMTYSKAGYTDMAINSYLAVLRYDSTYSSAWSNLGTLYAGKGKLNDALGCYSNALKYDPDNAYAYNNIAAAYIKTGDYRNAIFYAEKAFEMNSSLYAATSTLAIAYCAVGDSEKSKKYYEIYSANTGSGKSLDAILDSVRRGERLVAQAVDYDDKTIAALREFHNDTSRPYAKLGIGGETSNKSRFGGRSLGDIPTDSQGKPMRLLCALYCSELHFVPDLPEKGILRFYIADNETYGADFKDPTVQKDFRVLYTPEEIDMPEGDEPCESETFPVRGCHYIIPFTDVMDMPCTDYRFNDTLDTYLKKHDALTCDEMDDALFEDICRTHNAEGHKAGGYPHFCQTDPRDNHPEFQKYDTLLLQIDTHETEKETKIMIGDSGVINFFIPCEKLKAKDFSDILYTWDCY